MLISINVIRLENKFCIQIIFLNYICRDNLFLKKMLRFQSRQISLFDENPLSIFYLYVKCFLFLSCCNGREWTSQQYTTFTEDLTQVAKWMPGSNRIGFSLVNLVAISNKFPTAMKIRCPATKWGYTYFKYLTSLIHFFKLTDGNHYTSLFSCKMTKDGRIIHSIEL